MAGFGGVLGKVPSPEKLRGPVADDEPDGDEAAPDDYGNDEDHAAEVSAADRVGQALGLKGVDAEELCAALKDFFSTAGITPPAGK